MKKVATARRFQTEQEILERLFSSIHVLVAYLDLDFNFIRVNQAYAAADGHEPAYYVGKNHFALFPNAENKAIFQTVVKTGKPATFFAKPFEYAGHPERGMSYWDWRLEPIKGSGGKVEGLIFTLLDVTEQTRSRKTLEETISRLNEAQRVGRIGNWDWDALTDTIMWSEQYYRIFGVDPSTKPPKYDEHLKAYTPESAARLDAAVKRNMKTGEPYALDLEFAHIRPGGARWITARSETKRDQNGKITGLRGTAQDITERKLTELELVRVNRALQLLSAANQALMKIHDEQKLLDTISKIVVNIGGYRLMWIGYAEQDAQKSIRPVCQAGFEKGYLKSAAISWGNTKQGRGPTGTAIRTGKTQLARDITNDPRMAPWREMAKRRGYRSSIALPLSDNGSTFGALNIYATESDAFGKQEVTTLEELSDNLAFGIANIRMRAQVEERTREVDQLKNKFIQIVSHQLRTPLNIIRWNLDTLLRRERDGLKPSQEAVLRGTYAATAEIISRIDDLMVAIDIEEGRFRLDTEETDLVELIRSACGELGATQQKQMTCRLTFPKGPIPPVMVDAAKIRDVVRRLVDNAIAYSKEHGRITVTLSARNGRARFQITDTGIGIPASEQHNIFNRFYRGWNAPQMRPDASGLGLYIAKHYVESHGGTIGFTSKENKGSTFWFEIPTRQSKAARVEPRMKKARRASD